MARKKPWISLRIPKVRQSWNKYNLYNVSRLLIPKPFGTYYQQKWNAKSISRPYHGDQVREKQWTRMFSRRIPSVQPMDYRYLAESDGSLESAGRGAGEETLRKPKTPIESTPYMQMVYHQLERRLDTAVFRAMFASSIRQARQFVARGLVRVNGQKMPYPGYMLNPGDMFSLPPDVVMYATGQRKGKAAAAEEPTKVEAKEPTLRPRKPRKGDVDESELDTESREVLEQANKLSFEIRHFLWANATMPLEFKAELVSLRSLTELEPFLASASKKARMDFVSQATARFASLKAAVEGSVGLETPVRPKAAPLDPEWEDTMQTWTARWRAHREAKGAVIDPENPVDPEKPYKTPWRPRDYMSAFAFIPRYLEVNQNVCSAVYLRHPVARPGLGEVPTPFPLGVNQLAFNWYLRRR